MFELSRKTCVCVGGGGVAARRIPALLAAGAHVTVVSPSLSAPLLKLHADGAISHLARKYEPSDIQAAFFVLAATDDAALNRDIGSHASRLGALCCVASDAAAGNCSFMSTIRRGALTIAVDSGGGGPLASIAASNLIDQVLPESLGPIIDQLAEIRSAYRALQPDLSVRGMAWKNVASSGAVAQAMQGDLTALDRIRAILGMTQLE